VEDKLPDAIASQAAVEGKIALQSENPPTVPLPTD